MNSVSGSWPHTAAHSISTSMEKTVPFHYHTSMETPRNQQSQHIISLLSHLIEKGSPKQFHLFFQKYHEADIADALEELPFEKKHHFFLKVNPEIAVEVLEEMEMQQQIEVILDFKTDLAAKFIEEMHPDDAVDLLEELAEEDQQKADDIIEALPKKEAENIKSILAYEEDTAGALMTSEFIMIPENLTVAQAKAEIRVQDPPDSEVSFYIFVVNDDKQLVGYTTLRNLVVSEPDTPIKDIRNDYPISVDVNEDQEEVAHTIQKYDLVAIPVVDDKKTLLGLITVDDVVDVVVEEATEDIYKLSGTSDIDEAKLISGKLSSAIYSRLPWLILTIFGGIIGAYIINQYSLMYESTLFSLALSLSFIPLLMGLGGNVGNQSSTIIVRGLSTGLVKEHLPLRYITRETVVGFLIGLIISAVVYVCNIIFQNPVIFSIIISVSIVCSLTSAAFIGSALPIIFKRLKIDPAVASAPFISTSLDIISQLIYFSMTLWIIARLS